ncbi:hypothetical protein DYB32_003050 [Aphanomyces invadans]|uniref:Uncharacterized protein n=1 Tax=Aphanomyces invadans TaxID=157072 RepID=A0A3R6VPK7_9STRA|nr:hypothetical protein DYB32_003050 [Aphanomyces invadans]
MRTQQVVHTSATDPWPAFLVMSKDFATAIAKAYAAGDILWLQDYDLVMVPHFLNRTFPRGTTVFAVGPFLHLPFPSQSVLSTLPFHLDILRSMLVVNHIGFHVYEHVEVACIPVERPSF